MFIAPRHNISMTAVISQHLRMKLPINNEGINSLQKTNVPGDQKVSVHLMITIQKVTSNVQSVPRQSPDIYGH
jgi:hypothetical protein